MEEGDRTQAIGNLRILVAWILSDGAKTTSDSALSDEAIDQILACCGYVSYRTADRLSAFYQRLIARRAHSSRSGLLKLRKLAHDHHKNIWSPAAGIALKLWLDGANRERVPDDWAGAVYANPAHQVIHQGADLKDRPKALHGLSVEDTLKRSMELDLQADAMVRALRKKALFALADYKARRFHDVLQGCLDIRKELDKRGLEGPFVEIRLLRLETDTYARWSRTNKQHRYAALERYRLGLKLAAKIGDERKIAAWRRRMKKWNFLQEVTCEVA
ncbi:MAG: hypothetical protein JNM89_05825 [Hyphomicrobiaceae bacterium]|nr:hypothetical protein [Hyphomicrobiaceae bacterium]